MLCIDKDFGKAFAKAELASGTILPDSGTVFISLGQRDKSKGLEIAKDFIELGFDVIATKHTAEFFKENGLDVKEVHKIQEGRPNVVDIISNKEVALIVNTPSGQKSHHDGYSIRRTALMYNVPIVTTLAAARASIEAIRAKRNYDWEVCPIQEHYKLDK